MRGIEWLCLQCHWLAYCSPILCFFYHWWIRILLKYPDFTNVYYLASFRHYHIKFTKDKNWYGNASFSIKLIFIYTYPFELLILIQVMLNLKALNSSSNMKLLTRKRSRKDNLEHRNMLTEKRRMGKRRNCKKLLT